MTYEPPEHLNLADYFLDARVREGRGDRTALHTDDGTLSYSEVQALANRFGNLLAAAGVEPEQRVLIALPDGPEFVGALFGTLRSEEHTSELQSRLHLVCRLLLEKKNHTPRI